jgi:hypothetical protein
MCHPTDCRGIIIAAQASQLPPECRQWKTRTSRMTYEWSDNGVNRVTVWLKAVRYAILKGGAEFQRQKVLKRATSNWSKRVWGPMTITLIGSGFEPRRWWCLLIVLAETKIRSKSYIPFGYFPPEGKKKTCDDAITMTLMVQGWFFSPF